MRLAEKRGLMKLPFDPAPQIAVPAETLVEHYGYQHRRTNYLAGARMEGDTLILTAYTHDGKPLYRTFQQPDDLLSQFPASEKPSDATLSTIFGQYHGVYHMTAEEKRRQSEEKAKELQRQIEELKAQSQEPDQQVLGELREQAQREAEQRFSNQIKKLQQEKEKAEQRVAEAEEKNRQLQSKSQQAGSRELIVFDEKFKAFQADFNELSSLLAQLENSDAQTAGKFRSAVQKLLTIMSANLEGSR